MEATGKAELLLLLLPLHLVDAMHVWVMLMLLDGPCSCMVGLAGIGDEVSMMGAEAMTTSM